MIVAFLTKNWILERLKAGIAHEYQVALEKLKGAMSWDTRRREQAAGVADILSYWSAPGFGVVPPCNEHLHELQRRYWTLAIGWIAMSRPLWKSALSRAAAGVNPVKRL